MKKTKTNVKWQVVSTRTNAELEYMNAIEKIFTIPDLIEMVKNAVKNHQISSLLDDFIVYYKLEFNF